MRAAVLNTSVWGVALMLTLMPLPFSTRAHADYITFTSGEVVWVESWELQESHYIFRMYGGVVSVPRDRVLKIQRQSGEEYVGSQLKSRQEKLRAELGEKIRALEQAEDELASRPNPDVATLKRERIDRLREEIQQLRDRLGE